MLCCGYRLAKGEESDSESGSGTSITGRSAPSFIFDHAERDGSGDDYRWDDISAVEAARVLSGMGVQHVIITLGSKGALICSDGEAEIVPALKVEAVDTTAAGDVFNGALTVALSEGRNLKESVRFACKASAISVTRVGAQSSAPYRNEVDIFD